MDISDLISQLSSLKSDREDWFEEYSISDLIDLDSSSSQQTTTPISSLHQLSQSSFLWKIRLRMEECLEGVGL